MRSTVGNDGSIVGNERAWCNVLRYEIAAAIQYMHTILRLSIFSFMHIPWEIPKVDMALSVQYDLQEHAEVVH
jgi:hypothetical protein